MININSCAIVRYLEATYAGAQWSNNETVINSEIAATLARYRLHPTPTTTAVSRLRLPSLYYVAKIAFSGIRALYDEPI
jgi:hypothetical protein